ncbi:hypothetical protein JAAARDRAFT_183899 [Jaapia argillacea MUCL 33604]|uniref:Uncharacterized protein n=1 Tax=Jaapia argillacea MUCL 33604 TaxID=933084 RepID=A0A067PFM6_9AGAM|nr:hypothetical protein JAAARDRAFT_183899 [Jaapia argillacea MUCL 33604]
MDAPNPLQPYGRNRQSIADIEQELNEIFDNHPQTYRNDAGDPVIPANALVDVFRTFSEHYHGVELITKEEEDQLNMLIESNPGLEVTPTVLLQFIAMRTGGSPQHSPHPESPHEEDTEEYDRGRSEEWERRDHHSRSSSNESAGTSVYRSRPSSRGPPVPPKTPSAESPFDTSRRQRSTPLSKAAPSSWTKRPLPAARRRSVDGGHGRALSDSESSTGGSSSFSRSGRRSRAPSDPNDPNSRSAPNLSISGSFSPPPNIASPPSRPHSRAQSYPESHFVSLNAALSPGGDAYNQYGFSDDHDEDLSNMSGFSSPPIDTEGLYDYSHRSDDDILSGVNSLPMPRRSDSDSDSDSDGEERTLGLVLDRSAASSTVSLEPSERVEALQRTNVELGRKLVDAERTLQNRLTEHELELEEMQARLEEVKSELSATKREEKELRAKERQNTNQIAALESEIAKLQRSLDNSKTAYTSLQKQYQEQCAESERYRNTLRRYDQEIKDLHDQAGLQAIEGSKWAREQANYEERVTFLEGELSIAQQTHAQLEEQKQENMLLKETIDRMRYDMDELRNNASSHVQGGSSGAASAQNTISKSLGAELLSKMGGRWSLDDEDEDDHGEEERSSEGTAVEAEDSSETESEDVIQTIITRTKKKVASRARKFETFRVDEMKEYSDAYTQHEISEFTTSSSIQTDAEPKVLTASFSIQTDELPIEACATQTDPEPIPPPKITIDMEIQTDEIESAIDDETMASSSSTLLPPTPKVKPIEHHDLPPSYSQISSHDQEEHDLHIAAETLKKWHKGISLPFQSVASGVSEDAVEEWKSLKDELGVECMVIDKVIEESVKTGHPRLPKDGRSSRRKSSSRFYNIYNTYVYGNKDHGEASFPGSVAAQVLLCIGASAVVLLAMRPIVVPQYIVASPTYYDRAAWQTFNTMYPAGEGLSPDGTAAVWNLFGRLGGGAARIARGWPT